MRIGHALLRQTCWACAIVIAWAMPVAAQDAPAETAEQDALLGRWCLQVYLGQAAPVRSPLAYTFTPDGRWVLFAGTAEEMTFYYEVNAQGGSLDVYDVEGGQKVLFMHVPYAIEDGVLTLTLPGGPDDERDMVLTRNPEGTDRHRQLRAAPDAWDTDFARSRCTSRMQTLYRACMNYAEEHGGLMPTSTGQLVALGYVDAEYAFTPWSDVAIPEGFAQWDDARKADWVNTHTSFVYVDPGSTANLSPNRMIYFDLPASEDAELVSIFLQDGDKWTRNYAEADADVREDTGHSIAQWMESTSPGSGRLVLPREDAE